MALITCGGEEDPSAERWQTAVSNCMEMGQLLHLDPTCFPVPASWMAIDELSPLSHPSPKESKPTSVCFTSVLRRGKGRGRGGDARARWGDAGDARAGGG
jgi:hypothetical protein